jgi:hypothetical protein|tara:strand:- start:709 stop:966 length:258 start_codon:yes stop_codon:yes gene_type:complete
MSEEEYDERSNFQVGDIVQESSLIIPPDRDVWTGIVVHVDKDRYNLYSELGPFEDMIYVHWFRAGYIESLPASVIVLVQKAKEKS